jgi:flagellar hook-length control protein FliK
LAQVDESVTKTSHETTAEEASSDLPLQKRGARRQPATKSPNSDNAANEPEKIAAAQPNVASQPGVKEQLSDSLEAKKAASANSNGSENSEAGSEATLQPSNPAVIETSGELMPSAEAAANLEKVSSGNDTAKTTEPLSSRADDSESSDADKGSQSADRQTHESGNVVAKATVASAGAVAALPHDRATTSDLGEGVTKATSVGETKSEGMADTSNRFQAGQGTKGLARTTNAEEMPRVDPARFIGRVAKAFHTAQERGGTLQIRLSPPELGAMRLELTVKDGVMAATLETENASAKRVLLEHLPALRERLAEQNIRVDRFDVDVRREGAGGQADPRAAQDQQNSQQGHPERRQPRVSQVHEPSKRTGVLPMAQPQTTASGINLVV